MNASARSIGWNGQVSDGEQVYESVDERLGESRWPPAIAVLVFLALNVTVRIWIPEDRAVNLPWLLPIVEVLLLGALLFADPVSLDRRAHQLRKMAIVLVCILAFAALYATGVLIKHLIEGAPQTSSGGKLLAAGGLVWTGNVLAFSLLYWVFDGGGPSKRAHDPPKYPDFLFPQFESEHVRPGWRAVYWDYLYLGFCTSTAFSPTDVMPLKHWTKGAMALQSAVSLAVIGLVIARAVNVLT
jgi:hypothetical protein